MNDNNNPRSIDTDSLFWGLALVGIGLLFLLDRFEVANLHFFFHHYWPLFIVFLGLSKIVRYRTLWAGFWLLTVGVWLQITTLHLFGLTFGSSWPLLLIALGAGIVLRTFFDSRHGSRSSISEDGHE